MTYSPRSPGYPPAQQPPNQYSTPTQQFSRPPEPAANVGTSTAEGNGKLPVYLTAVVAVLGLAVYVSSFGPYFTAAGGADLFTPTPLYLGIVAAVLAGLFAGVAVLPKQTAANAAVAALSVLGFLLVIGIVITAPSGVALDWGLYLIIAFSALQAIVAVVVLLFDAGVIAPPAPRPAYEQPAPPQQYSQYSDPGPYYGQQRQAGPSYQSGPAPQGPPPRPGYSSQYGGGYSGGGYSSGPSTGGFPSLGPQSGPPTPPTGFPAYRQPPPSSGSAPTTQVPTQSQSSSSQQSGKSSS